MSILRRLPGSRYSEVFPEWQGDTAVLIAGGPSLTLDQVAMVKRAHDAHLIRAVVVNDAYLLAPWGDVSYAADSKWHAWQTQGVAKPALGLSAEDVRARWARFAGQKCSIRNSGANITDDAVHLLLNAHGENHGYGLSLDPCKLVTGRNSGFQALNLVILAGAKRVILLGVDGRPAKDGRTHWFGEHPRPAPVAVFEEMRKAFSASEQAIIAAGVRVINCSPDTFIDSFPKIPLAEALT